MDTGFTTALARWRALIGGENVLSSEAFTKRYRGCEGEAQRGVAALRPARREELPAILAVARECKVALYPVSRGKNWGYGSANPAREGGVVLDLSRLDRIVEVNRELGYAVVEPGVTQQQLYDHLGSHDAEWWFDVTGSTPEGSILGNVLERGFGQTPYSDHFANACGMEVLLANGSFVRTGFGRFANAKTGHLYKWGVGPYLDGIFTQSNFGIVTELGVWLFPRPQTASLLMIKFAEDEDLAASVASLRRLKLERVLPSAVHIANDFRVAGLRDRYPAGARELLSPAARRRYREERKLGAWNCIAGLWGSPRMVASATDEVREALATRAEIEVLPGIEAVRGAGPVRDGLAHLSAEQLELLGFICGRPSSVALNGAYWRKPESILPGVPPDIIGDRCGILWCAPIIPFTAVDCRAFIELSEQVLGPFGFELNVTISLLSDRAGCCTVGLLFDAADAAEVTRARECHAELQRRYVAAGYVPYRMGSGAEHAWGGAGAGAFMDLCDAIRRTLDPDRVLAPGRYGIE